MYPWMICSSGHLHVTRNVYWFSRILFISRDIINIVIWCEIGNVFHAQKKKKMRVWYYNNIILSYYYNDARSVKKRKRNKKI